MVMVIVPGKVEVNLKIITKVRKMLIQRIIIIISNYRSKMKIKNRRGRVENHRNKNRNSRNKNKNKSIL